MQHRAVCWQQPNFFGDNRRNDVAILMCLKHFREHEHQPIVWKIRWPSKFKYLSI